MRDARVSTADEPEEGEEDEPAHEHTTLKKIGGSVLAPQLLEHSEAEFDEAARKVKYSGKCWLRLIVDTDGRPRHIRIDRALGLGLDEEAVDAVEQYLFKPASENGKAVRSEVVIEVSFQIY